ncbi:CDP-alcohol phosphatidyltransferase family protein [Brachybacterium sp. AOP43-C2-M15]|uniref:CDP-alcohol phosphatidyltransferase family protein n=1 Tax=Brachybacterium sp. AOP43-C2-M15 TaxID=3457661 RepID=UPI00403392D3
MALPPRSDWATIPNLVTLLRFLLLGPVCVLLLDGPDTLAVVLLLVWALTDWVDGLLARLLDQASRTGAVIDPIADRIGLAAIVLSLAVAGLVPWAALAIIVLADLAMAVLATSAALGGRISVSWLGKVRTFVLMSAVFLLVAAAAWAPALVPAAQVLFWIGVVLHAVSGIDYVLRARWAPAAAPAGAGPPSRR